MFISSKEVEALIGQEQAVRLCAWIKTYSPVTCKDEQEDKEAVCFNLDEAIEFAKIKMLQDSFKREFLPHLVKLKHAKVSCSLTPARSA